LTVRKFGDIVIAIPCRDLLAITGSNDVVGIENLKSFAEKMYREGDHSYYAETNPKLFEDYPTQETNNSVQLYNSLNNFDEGDYIDPQELQQSYIVKKLNEISTDLGDRWQGALFSLNPHNPDASRHFCTSVREIFTQVIDIKAPDYSVTSYFPNCELYQGKPNI